MLAWFKRGLALMPPKAYRWIAEMHEIAGFVSEDPAAHELYRKAAHFYEGIAKDFESGTKKETAVLAKFSAKARPDNGTPALPLIAARKRAPRTRRERQSPAAAAPASRS